MNSTEEWMLRPNGLAVRLRELRQRADMTGAALAAKLGWIQPKVSKIENGKQVPPPENVRAWALACGADDETIADLLRLAEEARVIRRQWREQVRRGQAAIQHDYDELARQSSTIRNAEIAVVPGLLQTPGYARAQAMQGVRLYDADASEIDAAVAARMRRQEILYAEPLRRFEFVMTEATLRMLWCPREDMLAQLDRLVAATMGPPHVWFGIIPFGVEVPVVAQTRFVMFDDLVLIEDYVDETTYQTPEAAAGFARAMDALMAEAVTGGQARRLIVRALDELRL